MSDDTLAKGPIAKKGSGVLSGREDTDTENRDTSANQKCGGRSGTGNRRVMRVGDRGNIHTQLAEIAIRQGLWLVGATWEEERDTSALDKGDTFGGAFAMAVAGDEDGGTRGRRTSGVDVLRAGKLDEPLSSAIE